MWRYAETPCSVQLIFERRLKSNEGAAIHISSKGGGTVEMNGGTISGCTSTGDGGAVYADGGTFTMNGGTITGNSAVNNGGGIYNNKATVYVYGGKICGNACPKTTTSHVHAGQIMSYDGGMVYVYGGRITDDGASVGCTLGMGKSGSFQLHGGVFAFDCEYKASGVSSAYLGANGLYIYGKNIGVADSKLQSGNFTFNPSSYVTLYQYSTVSGSGTSYTVYAPYTVAVQAVQGANVSVTVNGSTVGSAAGNYKVPKGGSITATYSAKSGYVMVGSVNSSSLSNVQGNQTLSTSGISTISVSPTAPSSCSNWAQVKAVLEAGYDVKLTADMGTSNMDSNNGVNVGAGTRTLDMNGHTVTAQNGHRFFRLTNGNLTITGTGMFDGNGQTYSNGGHFAYAPSGKTLTIDGDVTIKNMKSATTGGAICVDGALVMNAGTITGCYSPANGGAVDNNVGTFTMNGGTISGCTASWGGGAIYNNNGGTFTMNGGTISGNTADCGGALYNNNGTVYVYGGTIRDNEAKGNVWSDGGFCFDGNNANCHTYIYGGYFSGNKAPSELAQLFFGYGDKQSGYLYGGVFAADPTADAESKGCLVLQDSAVVTQVGSNYVVGKGVTTAGDTVKSGSFTFDPATYGVSIYSKSTLSGSGMSYTVTAPISVTIPTVAHAHVSGIKVNTETVPVATPVEVSVGGDIAVTYAADKGYILTGDTTATLTNVTEDNKTIDASKVTVEALTPIGGDAWAYVKDGVCTISGTGAMADCEPGKSPLWGTTFDKVVIGDGVTSVGRNFFAYMKGVRDVEIGGSVTNVAQDAFYFCRNMTNLVVGAGVQSVGTNAFERCNALESIVLGRRDIAGMSKAFSITSRITMEGGKPVVDTVPVVSIRGFKLVLKGSENLGDDWETVEDPTDIPAKYHFFKFEFEAE